MEAFVRKLFGMMALAAAALAMPAPLTAQSPFRLGAQASWGDDSDAGLGVRYENDLNALFPGARNLRFVGSFDYFFPGSPVNYWEINTNVAWGFAIPGSRLGPYVGGGLNIAHASVDNVNGSGDTKVGFNALGGLRFPGPPRITPFIEARLELRDNGQFVLTGGLLFF